jgi:hypothetical protein
MHEICGLENMIKANIRYFSNICIYQKLIQGTNCYFEDINLTILSIMVEKLCVMRCIYSEDVLLGNNKNKQNKLNSFMLPSEYRVMLSTSNQHLTLRRRIFLPKNEKPSK